MVKRPLRILFRICAFVFGGIGVALVGVYVVTAARLYITNAPDKSLVFWYLIFLFMGIASGMVAVAFFHFSSEQ